MPVDALIESTAEQNGARQSETWQKRGCHVLFHEAATFAASEYYTPNPCGFKSLRGATITGVALEIANATVCVWERFFK